MPCLREVPAKTIAYFFEKQHLIYPFLSLRKKERTDRPSHDSGTTVKKNEMEKINTRFKKQSVCLLLAFASLHTACEDAIPTPETPAHDPVEVRLTIGLADDTEPYSAALPRQTATRQAGKAASFSYELQRNMRTKTTPASLKPDKLYNLEIQQYDASGQRIGGMAASEVTNYTLGSELSVTLAAHTDCQLVLVAWGNGNTTRLGTGSLADAQQKSIPATTLSALDPLVQADMNRMPYSLRVNHLRVENGRIQSLAGADVRLLLRRLAVRLTLDWSYTVADYTLRQILLQSIPLNYTILPAPDKDGYYPSLLDQYTTVQLTAAEIAAGHYACWIPANVRGSNAYATSLLHRTKKNAPIGSSHIDFIAQDNVVAKNKLSYRLYLGGPETTDFNLYSNGDYAYTLYFNHTGLPVDDQRVTIIQPIPASENNNNFVATGNCFMIPSGGAFCFNPYKYEINGQTADNALLQSWAGSGTRIASVKVLWQTKENGDIGDPVLGTVNSAADHSNIVELTDGDDFEKARIYCRTAPNTLGGSGAIAAFDENNEVLWSWHLWVTDYAPDALADRSVDEPAKRIQKYTYGGKTQYPMMDRNLGAKAGYTDIPDGNLEKSKTNGFHYQWGRKDPFPSSYSETAATNITINSDKPTPGMLNLYQPDGITYFVRGASATTATLRTVYQHPTVSYAKSATWCSQFTAQLWNDASNQKTVHDPCPAGWRVASMVNFFPFFTSTTYTGSGTNAPTAVEMNLKNKNSVVADGGAVLYFENTASGRSTFIRMTGYQEFSDQFNYIGGMGNLWCRESLNSGSCYSLAIVEAYYPYGNLGAHNISAGWASRDANPLRCIQDRP